MYVQTMQEMFQCCHILYAVYLMIITFLFFYNSLIQDTYKRNIAVASFDITFLITSQNNMSNNERPAQGYLHFMTFPLKIVACWDWFVEPKNYYEIFTNNIYLAVVLFLTVNLLMSLTVHIYLEWTDIMSSLDLLSDGLPILVMLFITSYFSIYKKELYELTDYIDKNFKWHSACGLTNMTMQKSYETAKKFAYFYTACTLFSVTIYTLVPILAHLVMEHSLPWMYEGITQTLFLVLIFLRQCLVQVYVALALGQLGVFFASNSILLCGQLDILCCSLRNLRYTALLKKGIRHKNIVTKFASIQADEEHNFIYNESLIENSTYHFNENVFVPLYEVLFMQVAPRSDKLTYDCRLFASFLFLQVLVLIASIISIDIYDPGFDEYTCDSIGDCAKLYQVINEFKNKFEYFISPLLVIRVVQCTIYLCTLLYAATVKFDLATIEYLVAVALDIFIYCYYGNQIILQADRVSVAAYQSAWHTMGTRPRKMLLNMLQSSRKPIVIRADRFLPIDLNTFVLIIKTSFSYYTLLVSVNEEKQ